MSLPSRENALRQSARVGDVLCCWCCGQPVSKPVVKRRYERLNGRLQRGYGVYHHRCKARDDR